ncbi:TMV resistance protein N isoform X1 [Jatropha curcas]|uniref:TMV resistance protein N isoform X1 n=1 Tax=Jatropha curcas TaxID=180498 RepID=UPI0005FAA3D8|nr:TMV resistance protein N isoform X1 [Jatropha curcas]
MASTSSTAVRRKCDVFLNFRGGDTCENFVSELCKTLNRNLIETFIIDDKFGGRGGEEEILRKIQEADISSVIFSEDYASSALCMDELLKIVECKETKGQTVIPVFYRVDPTHVQHLKGNFGFGFDKLTQELRNSLPKVESWRSALIKTAYLKGWDSHFTKPESKLIHEIVNDILKKLNQVFFNGSVLVGISSHIREVESLLSIESQGVRSIGIWGMGGIGKTTITEVLFSRISAQFECQCYVPNVREQLEKRTVAHIRAEILSKLLGMENSIVRMPYIFPNFIRNKLRKKKVLIVLDDVDNSEVVRDLVGDCHLYGSGSRIIVTSRDKQVLKNADIKEYIYEVEKLVDFQAILLFSLHAFKQDAPPEEFMKLSERAITYAQGIPLAIKILGSSLYCKSVNEWESELAKLENSPDRTIEEVLKISYDGLESSEQSIFLDIACFFKGEDRTRIQSILNGCGFFADIGISRLLDKSLITISSNNQLEMHDLLQQMGRNIVCLECIHQPGERSRLWIPQDVYLVLKREKGTGNIEGISLDKSKIRDIELSPTVFERMYNLRLLEFHNPFTSELKIYLPKGLQFLPDELRFLRWDKYPSKSLPTSFCAEKLMELHMRESQLRELWNGVQNLGNLVSVDLSNSKHLVRIPDLCRAQNLEVLKLTGCTNLVEIPSSIQNLSKLTRLILDECKSLDSLLSYLPQNIRNLSLDGSTIKQLPPSIGELKCLETIVLRRSSALTILPDTFCNLKSLIELHISDCPSLNELPLNLGNLESLKVLHANRSGLKNLPSSVDQLRQLESLDCSGCKDLMLPPFIDMPHLEVLYLNGCGMSEFPQGICSLKSLTILDVSGNNFESIPASIKQLSNLERLLLRDCKRLQYLPDLPLALRCLYARNCTSLESASTSFLMAQEPNYQTILDFYKCMKLNQGTYSRIMDDILATHLVNDRQSRYIGAKMYIAGSEMAENIRYHTNNGSSLSFTIDQQQPDLIGFSLCAVVASNGHPPPHDVINIRCRALLTGESGHSHIEDLYFFSYPDELDIQSETLFLWANSISWDSEDGLSKASFHFFMDYHNEEDEDYYECKEVIVRCGVHPIFKDKKSKNKDENEESQQPPLKRLKEEHLSAVSWMTTD